MSSRSFDEMDRMVDQMDRFFAQMRDRFSRNEFGANMMEMPWARGMAVDVHDEEDALMVVADLPGYDLEDIDLSIRGNVLDIRAEHESDSEHVYRTRSVSERVTIPTDIDVEDTSATYRNGVLEICLPYASGRAEAHHIDIE